MIVFLIPTSPQNTMLPLTTNTCSPKQHFIFHFFFLEVASEVPIQQLKNLHRECGSTYL